MSNESIRTILEGACTSAGGTNPFSVTLVGSGPAVFGEQPDMSTGKPTCEVRERVARPDTLRRRDSSPESGLRASSARRDEPSLTSVNER